MVMRVSGPIQKKLESSGVFVINESCKHNCSKEKLIKKMFNNLQKLSGIRLGTQQDVQVQTEDLTFIVIKT